MMRVRKRRKKTWIRTVLPLVVILGAVVGIFCYINSLAYKVCRVEAGVEITASDFMKDKDPEAYFTKESQAFDIQVPGEYQVIVKSGWFQHKATLIIQDTVAPVGSSVELQLEYGESCSAEELVAEVSDATTVTAAFADTPDFQQIGNQSVDVILTDLGGNFIKVSSLLTIVPIHTDVTMEAGGEAPEPEQFVITGSEAAFITQMAEIDYHVVQELPVQIQVDGKVYESMLHIKDTVAPVVKVQEINGYSLVERPADSFVTEIIDETAVEISYVDQPDFSKIGTQEILLRAVDGGGNEVFFSSKLTLEADTEAPVITGEAQVLLFIGDTVSYRKLAEVTDNCEEGLELVIESSQVNLNAAGVYPVTYTATDLAGNSTSMVVELTVQEREHSIEEVNALADEVLSKIITENMTPLEKVQAIYNYNMSHIGYINHSDKVDWVKAAYEGLALGKGDCFVYASTAKILLTRAGITNMDIAKIPAKTSHYWNLVDIGDGWYHFDTTPRKDRPTIFMWTDAQLMEYSAAHNNCHNYDHEAYPEVN